MIELATELIFGDVIWNCLSQERLTGAASEMELFLFLCEIIPDLFQEAFSDQPSHRDFDW